MDSASLWSAKKKHSKFKSEHVDVLNVDVYISKNDGKKPVPQKQINAASFKNNLLASSRYVYSYPRSLLEMKYSLFLWRGRKGTMW